jgi:tetratricopeptide (TPR) repeat protein
MNGDSSTDSLYKVIEAATQRIEIDPREADAYYSRGSAYYDKELFDLGIKDYSSCIAVDSRCGKAYRDRGVGYGDKGLHDLAVADFKMAFEIDPGDAKACRLLGFLDKSAKKVMFT